MPTTVRAAGVGSSSLVSKIGGVLSTSVAALADIDPAIPTVIFEAMSMGRKMQETIDDVEWFVLILLFID